MHFGYRSIAEYCTAMQRIVDILMPEESEKYNVEGKNPGKKRPHTV